MTQRPHADPAPLEHMLRQAAAAAACVRCPARTRRTTRRAADGQLEVRCAGCGSLLPVALRPREHAPGDLP
jgi:hypothetical protein